MDQSMSIETIRRHLNRGELGPLVRKIQKTTTDLRRALDEAAKRVAQLNELIRKYADQRTEIVLRQLHASGQAFCTWQRHLVAQSELQLIYVEEQPVPRQRGTLYSICDSCWECIKQQEPTNVFLVRLGRDHRYEGCSPTPTGQHWKRFSPTHILTNQTEKFQVANGCLPAVVTRSLNLPPEIQFKQDQFDFYRTVEGLEPEVTNACMTFGPLLPPRSEV